MLHITAIYVMQRSNLAAAICSVALAVLARIAGQAAAIACKALLRCVMIRQELFAAVSTADALTCTDRDDRVLTCCRSFSSAAVLCCCSIIGRPSGLNGPAVYMRSLIATAAGGA